MLREKLYIVLRLCDYGLQSNYLRMKYTCILIHDNFKFQYLTNYDKSIYIIFGCFLKIFSEHHDEKSLLQCVQRWK